MTFIHTGARCWIRLCCMNKTRHTFRTSPKLEHSMGISVQCSYLSTNENVCTKLSHQLKARIKAVGPITVADYMKEVLTNPIAGYYQHQPVFGQEGDFITSPEISQMFGELISVWFVNEWQKIGSPKPLQIVELGPGRGTLMQDLLKVLNHFQVTEDASVHLVEVSHRLSELQAKNLGVRLEPKSKSADKLFYQTGFTANKLPVYWYYDLCDVPQQFSFIIANEFFDAMPIHIFKKTAGEWREVLVDLSPNDTDFRFVLSPIPTPSTVLIRENETREHVELSPKTAVIAQHLATRLEEDGGIALLADYGYDGTAADTFRAFRNHKFHDPLVEPGSADLTADVDFSLIRTNVEPKLLTYGPVSQRKFLERMGIDVRLQILLDKSKGKENTLKSGYHMLVDEDKMGKRFKFFAMFPAVLRDYHQKFPVNGFSE